MLYLSKLIRVACAFRRPCHTGITNLFQNFCVQAFPIQFLVLQDFPISFLDCVQNLYLKTRFQPIIKMEQKINVRKIIVQRFASNSQQMQIHMFRRNSVQFLMYP